MSDSRQIDVEVLPDSLCKRAQWLCWREEERDGKPTKIPVTPETGAFASSTDPETWTDFETAVEYARSDEADGLGFVFTDDDSFVGIDLDDCRDPETGSVDDGAREIVNQLNSYTEVSPSGTGFHVLIKGELPEGRNRKGSVEMYDSARFFTMTGDRVDVKPQTVEERQKALAEVHREYVHEPSMAGEAASAETNGTPETPTADVDLTDEELIEKARNAANGEKFERLWRGDISSYESQSEADMAFCCLLAFWTGGDEKQMDELFRQSKLIRPKWDEQHFADGATYGERTIERAVRNTSEFYEPSGGGESNHAYTTAQPEQASTIDTTSDSAETTQTDADDQSGGRERAYLKEQNKILTAKLEQREATIEQQQKQIKTLEAELEELRVASSGDTQIHDEQLSETEKEGDAAQSQDGSLWDRAKRLIDTDHT